MKPLPVMTEAEVLRKIAREVELAGTKALAARTWKISPQLLSLVLNGNRAVGPKLLKALRLRKVCQVLVRYEAA